MRWLVRLVPPIALAMIVAGCGRDAPATSTEEVDERAAAQAPAKTPWGETPVVEVGSGVITRERLERSLRARRLVAEKTGKPVPGPVEVLADLVDEELLVQLAIRLGVLAGDEALRGRLVGAALDRRLPGPRRPTDDELRAFVAAHRELFPAEERVRVRHILVKAPPPASGQDVTAPKQRAERIHRQVSRAPASFEAEARKQSEDPSAPYGGELGFLPVDRVAMVLGPDFPDAVAGVDVGKVGPIVRSAQGFHVFMVVDRKQANADPLEVQRREVVARFMEEERARERRKLLDGIRAEIPVKVHDPALAPPTTEAEDR